MAKTRNPTDSTLRNVRAAHTKIDRLARRLARLEAALRVVRSLLRRRKG